MTLDLARLRADAEYVVHNRDKWPELVVNGAFERIALLDRLAAAEAVCEEAVEFGDWAEATSVKDWRALVKS